MQSLLSAVCTARGPPLWLPRREEEVFTLLLDMSPAAIPALMLHAKSKSKSKPKTVRVRETQHNPGQSNTDNEHLTYLFQP
jgi:hypothetical protein